MNTGTSGSVSSIRPAETGSITATSASTAIGTIDREHELAAGSGRRRPRARRARHGGRRHLSALGAVERGRPVAQPPLDEVESELREHVRRGAAPATSNPQAGAARATTTATSSASGARDVCERGPAKARAATCAMRTAWASTSSAATSPSAASAASSDPHRPRAAQQARIDRPHRRLAAGLPREQVDRLPAVLAAEPRAEDVVRPGLVEQHDRERGRRRRPSSPSACSAPTRRSRS